MIYKVLFHTSGIALLEILFYFYYIGDMESTIFKEAMEGALDSIHKRSKLLPQFHVLSNNSGILEDLVMEESDYVHEFKGDMKKAEKQRVKENEKLFQLSLYYWYYLFGLSIMAYLSEIGIKYLIARNKRIDVENSSDHHLEMIDLNYVPNRDIENLRLRKSVSSFDSTNNDVEFQKMQDNSSTSEWMCCKFTQKDRQRFLISSLHYVLLCGSIILFEYLFFNHIIINYKIMTFEEMEYIFMKQLHDSLNHVLKKHHLNDDYLPTLMPVYVI